MDGGAVRGGEVPLAGLSQLDVIEDGLHGVGDES